MTQFKEPSRSTDPLTANLNKLRQHGWKCEQPGRRSVIPGADCNRYECVWCDGVLFGVPRSAYLSVMCGRVLLIGETVDVSFEEFLTMLGLDDDPALEKSGGAAATNRQKSLFE